MLAATSRPSLHDDDEAYVIRDMPCMYALSVYHGHAALLDALARCRRSRSFP